MNIEIVLISVILISVVLALKFKELIKAKVIENRLKVMVMVFVLVMPLILLILTMGYFSDIDKLIMQIGEYKGKVDIKITDFPSISDIIYYLIYLYTLISTAIFSYFMWRTGEKGHKLAEEIKRNEEEREKEELRENALMVYYDLMTAFDALKKLKLNMNIYDYEKTESVKLFVREEFINGIISIKSGITMDEFEKLNGIYRDLIAIRELNDKWNYYRPLKESEEYGHLVEILKMKIDELSNRIFKKMLIEYFQFNLSEDIGALLNSKYYLLMTKIKLMAYREKELSNANIKYTGKRDGENGFNGEGVELYDNSEEPRFKGKFESGEFIEGTEKAYVGDEKLFKFEYDKGEIVSGTLFCIDDLKCNSIKGEIYKKIIESKKEKLEKGVYFNISKFNEYGKEQDGYIETIEITDSGKNIFKGSIKNGEKNGIGYFYKETESEHHFEIGNFKNGKLEEGERVITYKEKDFEFRAEVGPYVYTVSRILEKVRTQKIIFCERKKYTDIGWNDFNINNIPENKWCGKWKINIERSLNTPYGIVFHRNGNKRYSGYCKFDEENRDIQYHGMGVLYDEEEMVIFRGEFRNNNPCEEVTYENES